MLMDKSYPKVTIVTPSYNQGQFIEETILSVLNQTYKNIEYIVVDGGSTDNTMEVVNRYRDRIDIVIHEKDKGQADAINKGFKLAKGELVGWINSDDILYCGCVEKIVDLYRMHPEATVYYSSTIDIIDQNGKFIKKYCNLIPNKKFLLKRKYSICQQGSFYSVQAVKKVNYINEALNYCMDLDLWLRLLEYGPICRIDNNSCAAFREWELAKTSTAGRKFLLEIRKILLNNGAKIYNLTVLKTYWYQLKYLVRMFLTPEIA